MTKLSVVIVHAAHIEERAPLMKRLRRDLGVAEFVDHDEYARPLAPIPGERSVIAYHEETTRGPWWVWHALVLRAHWEASKRGATHALTLQDDAIVCSTFWPVLLAMLGGRPNDVICLDPAHPGARRIFLDGDAPGYTTPDGMIGIGYALPMKTLDDYARWRLVETCEPERPELYRMWGEDLELAAFCMARGLPIFHPVPCPLDHDLTITSTNDGYDDHWYRKPQVTMAELERLDEERAAKVRASTIDPAWWAQPAPSVGRFYDNVNHLSLIMKDRELAAELVRKYTEQTTPKRFARFWSRVAATSAP